MIDYFKQPGFLKTRHHYPSGLKKSSTFGAHMDEVVFALEVCHAVPNLRLV